MLRRRRNHFTRQGRCDTSSNMALGGHCAADAAQQLLEQAVDDRVQLMGQGELVHQSDSVRLCGGEYLGGQHVAPRVPLAHRAHQVRQDGRGGKADLDLRQAELGVLGGDRDVAGGDQPYARRRPRRARGDRGLAHGIDAMEQAAHLLGVADVVGGCPGAHAPRPGQVAARA